MHTAPASPTGVLERPAKSGKRLLHRALGIWLGAALFWSGAHAALGVLPPAAGPVAAWSFDTIKADTVVDDSGHGNDGRIARAFLVDGLRGMALRFDDRTMYVRVPHTPDLIPSKGLSIEAWIRPSVFPPNEYATVVRKNGAYALRFGADGRVGMLVWQDGKAVRLETQPATWRSEQWHHTTGVWDGTALHLYLDGRPVVTAPFAGPIDETATPLYIGGCAGQWPFSGVIDEVRVFSYPLTAAAIAADFAAGQQALKQAPSARHTPREIGEPPPRFRKPKREVQMIVPGFVWIDAEDFTEYGGWLLDTQFVHLMGSGYLIAAGIGHPVKDAVTEFDLPTPGLYHLWVRARNWLPEYTPGTFRVRVNDQIAVPTFGAAKHDGWTWEQGGGFQLKQGKVRLSLHDLTGYYGRCDALILTTDAAYAPPATFEGVRNERSRLTGLSLDPLDGGEYDVIVVGAGAAGSVAALAAARLGARTALIQNRPVLGGNASIELGVGINGAASSHRNARETGIIEEVGRIKARYGYPKMSVAFQEAAAGEKRLKVFLNEHVFAADMSGKKRIASVRAVNTLTNRVTRYRGKYFIDSTGDGWLGYFAGAKYRLGREARGEFNESLAPEKPDKITMSGCLMGERALGYRAVNSGHPAKYTPPPWAYKLPDADNFGRNPRGFVGGQWWLEHPGDIDDLWHAEKARDELLRLTFGYWDYIKNKWPDRKRAENYELVYVPIMDAKRESRRLIGDYILTQNDVQKARVFPDRISYGGWPLDVHHPRGIFSGKAGPFDCDPHVPIYTIPFRCLYSVNIENLLFAGRNASVTHIALGSVRVQGTLAALGQAAGTAAALCLKRNVSPRELDGKHIGELQQTLLKCDQSIPGIKNEDPADLARTATVLASSTAQADVFTRKEAMVNKGRIHPLDTDRSVILATGKLDRLDSVSLLLASTLDKPVPIELHLRAVSGLDALDKGKDIGTFTAQVPPKGESWVRFPVGKALSTPYVQAWLPRTEGLSWRLMNAPPEGACRAWGNGPRNQWTLQKNQCYAFYTDPGLKVPITVAAQNVIDGSTRIEGDQTHFWMSDPTQPMPQWMQLTFPGPVAVNTIHLTFDTDLNAPFHTVPLVPQCVRDYSLACRDGDRWIEVANVKGNFQRNRVHRFSRRRTTAVRLTIQATNGARAARVFEIRAYNEPDATP